MTRASPPFPSLLALLALASVLTLAPNVALAAEGAAHGPSEVIFLAQLITLMVVGRLLGEAMSRIGQPSVMGQLLAGILLGPSVLGLIWPDAQHALFPAAKEQKAMIDAISQFGILLLLLLTGMETDLKLVRKVGRAAISISLTGVAVPFACGVTLGLLMPESLAARHRQAAADRALPRHRAVDLLDQDRGRGRARDGLHAPQSRAGDRVVRDHGGHDRLGDHRDHVRPRPGRAHRRRQCRQKRDRNGDLFDCQLHDRSSDRFSFDPLGQRSLRKRVSRDHDHSRDHGHDGADDASHRRAYRARRLRRRDIDRRISDTHQAHRRAAARPDPCVLHAGLLRPGGLERGPDDPEGSATPRSWRSA